MTALKISDPVLAVLEQARLDGNKLYLDTVGQLERKLYTDVNKVLEAIGGKWNRGAKAHLFEEPVEPLIETILETRVYSRVKQDLGQFDSPQAVVDRVIELAAIEGGMWVLEPQGGIGNLAAAAEDAGGIVWSYEIDEKRFAKLAERLNGGNSGAVICADFLTVEPGDEPGYDRVVMNPPFAKQADIDHVLHAFKFLRPGGRLVSVMSAGAMQRVNRKAVEFREFVWAHEGRFVELPDSAFAESGTEVRTCIVVINR
jgi:protein-L-isoaspartate O-methyltransferase